ncbi:AcrR family transcriptional regulator [Actinomadura luteofluorescens]|uniref:AcrR family transcriptional regulator n=1 Tax=Actinomadura luteofluorescens TaxID=46163 RepID=A0A7Y9EQW4_9ACTN|nr:TetR/AcrR family transcriptional regulator [Actinomadura luteofluorescens]NYD52166.1 AcrR family transcriptional regulator [Actinomadura luteofluorescens]
MPRPRDPRRRTEILDAVLDHLAEHGMSGLSMRPIAQALGQSTRVLTHHFADKDALLAALLKRLDEVQQEQLHATEGWDDTARGIGAVVRDSWDRHLAPENIARTRLVLEIEGLAAAGRLGDRVPAFLTERAEFVAGALTARGLAPGQALVKATFLNGAYSGLQTDFLTTGDRERVEVALGELCALADSWTDNGA